MRTTIQLDDDVLAAARALAAADGGSLGAAVSRLARRGLEQHAPVQLAAGFPVLARSTAGRTITSDDVRAALEDG
jgi:hypothetical protein